MREDTDSDLSDEEDASDVSEELEERMAEFDRMQEEESYISLGSGHQSQLLNDEWDYSNSGSESGSNSDDMSDYPRYPQHDDHIIEEEIMRELRN